jgi:hypothetical protein
MSKGKGLTESDRGEAFAALSHDDRPTTFKDTLKVSAAKTVVRNLCKENLFFSRNVKNIIIFTSD